MERIRLAVHEFYHDKKFLTLESLLALVKERGLLLVNVLRYGVEKSVRSSVLQVNDKRYVYEQPSIIVQ